PALSLPRSLLSPAQITRLFQSNCASCHGQLGNGDGVLSINLLPKPTNFTDIDRAMNRSLMGIYDVISSGLEGTAMESFKHLTAKQRWSLAFEVGSLAFSSQSAKSLGIVDKYSDAPRANLSTQEWVQFSPKEIIDNRSDISISTVKRLRTNFTDWFSSSEEPLAVSRLQLLTALEAFKLSQFKRANTHAVSAYLDGFELIESSLDMYDKPLRKKIEGELLGLRQKLNARTASKEVESSISKIFGLLDEAGSLLNQSTMSDGTLFTASFLILLREGLEALLVVVALFTILVRSKKEEAIKYVHFGWVAAVLAGAVTWIVAQYLVAISGASREIMEGVAAMTAAIILFYVGFWMHNKSQSDQWRHYIQKNIDKSLTTGTLWGISGLAFIAVYREVFETVLFYQSLMTQVAETQGFVLVGGFLLATAVLVLIGWLVIHYSIKLPIARFFSSTSYLLLILSFILMGKSVAALQEAAIIGISPMPINYELDWLGISSTWQSFSAQLVILLLSIALILKTQLKVRGQK
ncbi:MAG: cytochrome c/FTR1 family iron permease, partial [Kangiellaceae bacterium]|nr:cytochrome c/FTR1 family iron permease [Kangiellaceae bacterium]